jgi:hypothetical protein
MNYDLSGFHATCSGKSIYTAGDQLYIYCPECGVVANVEAISGKISPSDACRVGAKDRIIMGDQSALVNKGEKIS